MLRLGQGTLGAGRGNLERVGLEQVAQQAGDALAKGDVDAPWPIDHQKQPLGGGPLEREQLDIRLLIPEPVLDRVLNSL